MLGLIAAIIAFVKKRYSFGVAMLVWWFAGLFFLFLCSFPYVLLPGPLFVIIAIKMRSDRVPKIKSDDESRITQCPKCGYDLVLDYAVCPNCGSPIKKEKEALPEDKIERDNTNKVNPEEKAEEKPTENKPLIIPENNSSRTESLEHKKEKANDEKQKEGNKIAAILLQTMKEMAGHRDVLFKRQNTEDPNYGYIASNPIMTSTISQSDEYLKKLRTTNGEPLTWNRTGSIYMETLHGVEGIMVDSYQLYLDGEPYKTLYICPYGQDSSYTPQGFSLFNLSKTKEEQSKTAAPISSLEEESGIKRNQTMIDGINEEINEVRFCRKCGHSLEPDSKFCRFCGTKVIVEGGE